MFPCRTWGDRMKVELVADSQNKKSAFLCIDGHSIPLNRIEEINVSVSSKDGKPYIYVFATDGNDKRIEVEG